MKNRMTNWTGPLLLCLALLGCDGASSKQPDQSTAPEEQKADTTLAMVLEASEVAYWVAGETVTAIDGVRAMAEGLEQAEDAGYTVTIDASHERAGQLRLVLETVPAGSSKIDLKAESDRLFESLKQRFDQQAKSAAMQEEAHHRAQAKAAAERVKQLQEELQSFIQITRGSPQTDASRLERRKLDRRIENALVEQIAAEKAVHQAEVRIDRERFVTLLRVR
ncbi:MAG: hypothetical protein KTR15_08650 [Phycisphaeraceae bacterium]|nr:hypothetical protein [Phycisphaeraceae bacterium]